MFIAITWSDHVFGVVESPRGSAVVLLLITTGVVFSGALFERRTWCRYLCFLGGISGNYTRSGMMELRAALIILSRYIHVFRYCHYSSTSVYINFHGSYRFNIYCI